MIIDYQIINNRWLINKRIVIKIINYKMITLLIRLSSSFLKLRYLFKFPNVSSPNVHFSINSYYNSLIRPRDFQQTAELFRTVVWISEVSSIQNESVWTFEACLRIRTREIASKRSTAIPGTFNQWSIVVCASFIMQSVRLIIHYRVTNDTMWANTHSG